MDMGGLDWAGQGIFRGTGKKKIDVSERESEGNFNSN